MKPIKRILIIRFRQIGDSILAIALCSTLKKSFPDAEIHFVLNKNIAPLYEGHPDIDKVITFDKNENKPFTAYIKKVWQVMHQNKYDIIIDMRSTIRTLFFSLFSAIQDSTAKQRHNVCTIPSTAHVPDNHNHLP